MRIAQINLPLFDNDGKTIPAAHEDLQRALCNVFGGYTVWEGNGAWMDNGKLYAEPVAVYQVAYDHKSVQAQALVYAAKEAGRQAGQIAVFIVIDGEAEIINIE